jgi:hypothetical protein
VAYGGGLWGERLAPLALSAATVLMALLAVFAASRLQLDISAKLATITFLLVTFGSYTDAGAVGRLQGRGRRARAAEEAAGVQAGLAAAAPELRLDPARQTKRAPCCPAAPRRAAPPTDVLQYVLMRCGGIICGVLMSLLLAILVLPRSATVESVRQVGARGLTAAVQRLSCWGWAAAAQPTSRGN